MSNKPTSGVYLAGVRLDALTYEDFDLLLSALESHTYKATSDNMISVMLASMLSRSKEEAEELMRKNEEDAKAREYELRRMKEAVAILRCKLILARRDLDSQEADRFIREATEAND